MKLSTLFLFLFLAGSSFSEVNSRWMAREFTVLSDTVNSTLPANQCRFVFHVDNAMYNDSTALVIRTAVNGVWRERTLDQYGSFSCIVEPGTYSFQFYFNEQYSEIEWSSLTIAPQHEMTIALRFMSSKQPIMVYKPVIYFHTDSEKEFDLSVNPVGNFTFVYPEMNDSWKGIVYPNGDITIDGTSYPYLFWESNQQYQFHSEGNGYKVAKNEVVSFLQKKLTELGLNQKEQTDFITFWGPKLVQNETSFVQFSIDESCDQFATLNCSPQPESVHRIYIQIAKWDPYFELFLNDLTFSSVVNESWSLLEWGGFTFTKPEQLTQY